MKLGLLSTTPLLQVFVPALLALSSMACSGTTNPLGGPGGDGGAQPPGQSGPPHAVGVIALGFEVDHTGAGSVTQEPSVLASFIPDSTQLPPVCAKTVSGCTVPQVAVCDGKQGPLCQSGQVCALDAACQPACQQQCTASCAMGEECYFPTATQQACRATQTFDAGYLLFSGTTTPLTLYPPYTFNATSSQGSLFAPGQPISVTAAGATGAGFAPFNESFTGTALLQTTPSLGLLSADEVFGAAGFSVGWQPGNDTVTVGISGAGGTATCPANDPAGTFTVPSTVVTAVLQTGPSGASRQYGTQTVTVSVTRQRLDQKTDAKTVGALSDAVVQPIGYLDLSTYSTETVTVTGTITPRARAVTRCATTGARISWRRAPTAARAVTFAPGRRTATPAPASPARPVPRATPAAPTAARTCPSRAPIAGAAATSAPPEATAAPGAASRGPRARAATRAARMAATISWCRTPTAACAATLAPPGATATSAPAPRARPAPRRSATARREAAWTSRHPTRTAALAARSARAATPARAAFARRPALPPTRSAPTAARISRSPRPTAAPAATRATAGRARAESAPRRRARPARAARRRPPARRRTTPARATPTAPTTPGAWRDAPRGTRPA